MKKIGGGGGLDYFNNLVVMIKLSIVYVKNMYINQLKLLNNKRKWKFQFNDVKKRTIIKKIEKLLKNIFKPFFFEISRFFSLLLAYKFSKLFL